MSLPPTVRISEAARADIVETIIFLTISSDNPSLADDYRQSVEKTLGVLTTFPDMGTHLFSDARIRHIRMFPVIGYARFLVFYDHRGDNHIDVIRVIHGSRDRARTRLN